MFLVVGGAGLMTLEILVCFSGTFLHIQLSLCLHFKSSLLIHANRKQKLSNHLSSFHFDLFILAAICHILSVYIENGSVTIKTITFPVDPTGFLCSNRDTADDKNSTFECYCKESPDSMKCIWWRCTEMRSYYSSTWVMPHTDSKRPCAAVVVDRAVCGCAAARPDAHPAYSGSQHLQLLGRGTAPSRGFRQEDWGWFPDSVDQLLVPPAAG